MSAPSPRALPAGRTAQETVRGAVPLRDVQFDSANASSVVVGLVDGNIRTGRVARFVPTDADLAVDLDRFGKTLIAAEHIAYVGFHRGHGETVVLPDSEPLEKLKVHVAGGAVFAVDAPASAVSSNLGFRAYPTDATSSFKFIYFYAHGINAREKDVPLGEMLVESGLLGPKTLRRGVDTQTANRNAALGQILVENGDVAADAVEQAAALQARRKLRIGQILVEAGLATQEAIERALAEQKQRKGKRLGEVLVEMGIVREVDLAVTLGNKFQIPVVDLDTYKIDPSAADEVPREVVEKYGVLPVGKGQGSLTVAISDPLAVDAIDYLRLHARRRIDEVLVPRSQLKRYVDERLVRTAPRSVESTVQLSEILRTVAAEELGEAEDEEEAREVSAAAGNDGGIVRVVNQIILDACRRGASDIHIEPNGKDASVAIRFRIDGDCSTYQEIPGAFRNQLIARIKIMAGLDISERRKPQDGKIRFRIGDRMVELRVATLPTVNGNEDAVLRVLASSRPVPLDQMGLAARNLDELRRVVRQPYGLVLCVGPTGSGKTTTLHSALGEINTADTKIWTAEDPVEITQRGLRQVQVSAKIGFTFAAAMRAFLRADPDVIMVGEMRDHETASTAVEASLTGHLVLSTLHTNTAPETVTRLLDMGLDPFSFSDSLLAVLAQRLARALCKKCRRQVRATDDQREEMMRAYGEGYDAALGAANDNGFAVWEAPGCDACGGTGYKGRVALHELLITDDAMRHAIAARAPVGELRRIAMARGMTTLAQDGVVKAMAGATDMKQVLAVCSK